MRDLMAAQRSRKPLAVAGRLAVALIAMALLQAGLVATATARDAPRDWRSVHEWGSIDFGDHVTAFDSDGGRYASFELSQVSVFDSKTDAFSRYVSTPSGCRNGTLPRVGYVLVPCAGSREGTYTVRLLPLVSGAAVRVPYAFLAGDDAVHERLVAGQWIADFGRRWMVVRGLYCGVAGFPACTTGYLDWHTGKLRSFASAPGARDLNSPDLRRRQAPDRVIQRVGGALLLRQVGRRDLRLGTCDGSCGDIIYGLSAPVYGGKVVWSNHSTVHGYVIRSHRFYAHRFPRLPTGSCGADTTRADLKVVTTQYRILVTSRCYSYPFGPDPTPLYTGAW